MSGQDGDPVTRNPFAELGLDDVAEDEQTSRPRKRRSLQPATTTKPDLEESRLQDGRRCVVIVDLASLDPHWGTGLGANRSLIEKHIDYLVQQIGQSDRRFDSTNRCQASVPDDTLERLLSGVPAEQRGLLQNFTTSKPEDLVVLNVPPGILRLEGGQHRRAAVLRLNGLPVSASSGVYRASDFETTKLSTMWPVEIYSQNFLTTHPLAQVRLRYNADPAKCKSGFGDDMAIVYQAWSLMDQRLKTQTLTPQRNFVDFLHQLLPGNTSVTSWLPLLKHDGWSYWIEQLVSHPWGRATLVASQLTMSFSSHHPRPFFTLFKDVDAWFKQYFPGVYQLIDAEDMRLFIDRSSHFGRTSNLRALFYPVWPKDFNVTTRLKVTGELHRLNISSLKDAHRQGTDPGFPDLSTPAIINGTTYQKRRPDFLSRLTDAQYLEVFNRLKSLDENAMFPNWLKVMKDDTQHTCQVFSSVMRHVISWVSPQAKPPAAHSSDVISYTWDDLVCLHMMPTRQLNHVIVPDEETRQDPSLSAQQMTDQIWMHCSTYCRDFAVDEVRPTLLSDVPGEVREITEQSAAEYTQRFTFPVWNTILQTVFDYLGPAFSTDSFMKHFNDPAMILEARLPWTIWGATTEFAHFVHNPELRRLPMIRNRFVRQDLRREAALWGAIFAYRHLKSVWLAHCRAVDAARISSEYFPEVLSESDRQVVEAAMCKYAEYLNSTGLYSVDPHGLEDLEVLRTSSILRYAENRRTQTPSQKPQDQQGPQRPIDPFVAATFPSSQPTPTPRPRKSHGRSSSQ